jgi:transcription factor IIIB subunit 2
MIGQFVSATSSKAYTGGGAGGGIRGGAGRYGFSRDSREATLAHGRRRIQDIASRLRLGSHFVDSAHRLFTIAVEKNFVQGRRTAHVVAACLYIACRQEKSQHMLIDFSDALQTNVFTLGTCFLKFRRLLGLKLEIIDPALYVYRFAAHLHLNDKANAVALTALRLVGRMKRDWITAGRRPAGICAGALLIAARAHGFDKHHSDVTRVLRVCGLTVSSRVREFERTPSARLTLDEFTSVDLDAEADPPVFQRNRFREARARAIAGGDVELLASGALDDPGGGKRASSWREPDRQRKNSGKTKLNMLYSSIDRELKGAAENRQLQKDDPPQESSIKAPPELADAATAATPAPTTTTTENSKGEGQVVPVVGTLDLSKIPDKWRRVFPKSNKGLTLVLPEQATDEERQAPTVPVELKIDLQDWKRDLPKEVAEEIDSIFVTEEEERQKEVIFNRINKDYLELQARKERDRQSAEAANERREREDAAQSEDHARFYNKMMSRRKRGAPLTDDATKTTEEHLMESIATRKVSRRINYEALSSIFGEDGSFATTDAIGNDGDDIDGDSERADAAGGGGDDDDRAIGAGEDPMFAQL